MLGGLRAAWSIRFLQGSAHSRGTDQLAKLSDFILIPSDLYMLNCNLSQWSSATNSSRENITESIYFLHLLMPEDIILVLPCNTSNLKITFRASRGFPFCWSIWRYINKRSYMNTGNRFRVKKPQKSPRKINKHRITLKTWNSFLNLWTLLATLLALFPGFNPFSVLWQFQNHQHGITHKIKPYNR